MGFVVLGFAGRVGWVGSGVRCCRVSLFVGLDKTVCIRLCFSCVVWG